MSYKLNIDEREKLFSKISEYNKTFNRLNDKAKFIYLLGSTQICDENVYQFINQCLKNSYSIKKMKKQNFYDLIQIAKSERVAQISTLRFRFIFRCII